MRRLVLASVLGSILLCGAAAAATSNAPAYIGRHTTTLQDTQAINKVIEDFQVAIKTRNPKLLSTLVLNSNILFDAPGSPEDIAYAHDKHDVTYDGLRAGGYTSFARFIATAKEAIEEKFYNIKITQDGNVAWVMFDYEFVVDGKTQNYGVETWQMMKVAGDQWKIASVMWTMNRPPK
jgi:ketosteroid isomerase-like protein